MARTIIIPAAPAAFPSPSIELYSSLDVLEETIGLTEATNRKGYYSGTIAVATAADYYGIFKSGASQVGAFEKVTVSGVDPETVICRDLVDTEGSANTAAILALLTGMTVTVSSPIIGADQQINLRQGMDYNNTDGRAIIFTGASADQWPNLGGSTVTFKAVQGDTTISKAGTVTAGTGTQSFYFEFAAADLTEALAPTGNYRYYITAELSSGRLIELVEDGHLRIKQPFSAGEA